MTLEHLEKQKTFVAYCFIRICFSLHLHAVFVTSSFSLQTYNNIYIYFQYNESLKKSNENFFEFNSLNNRRYNKIMARFSLGIIYTNKILCSYIFFFLFIIHIFLSKMFNLFSFARKCNKTCFLYIKMKNVKKNIFPL